MIKKKKKSKHTIIHVLKPKEKYTKDANQIKMVDNSGNNYTIYQKRKKKKSMIGLSFFSSKVYIHWSMAARFLIIEIRQTGSILCAGLDDISSN